MKRARITRVRDTFLLRLDPELKSKLYIYARLDDRSANSVVSKIVDEFIAGWERENGVDLLEVARECDYVLSLPYPR